MRSAPGIQTSGKTSELMCSYDLKGNIIEANEALERALGYSRAELRGINLSHLFDLPSAETARVDILKHVGGARPGPQRIAARAKDGRAVNIELTTRLVFEKGIPVAVQGFGQIMTKAAPDTHRQAEARLTAHLKQLHRLSTTGYDTIDQVFSEYLKTGCEVFCMQLGMLLQVDTGDTVVLAIHGASTTLHRGSHIPLNETHWASVADRLRTFVSTAAAAPWVHPELKVCLAAPVLVDNELYGTLSFSGPDVRMFSLEEQEVVELMASSLGSSILEDRIRSERKSGDDLERSRNRALEMMAENRPLPDTLAQLAAMVEGQCAGAICSVVMSRDGALGGDSSSQATDEIAGCTSPIISGTGLELGAMVVHFRDGSRNTLDPDIMRMACRLAGIAIEQRQLTERLEYQAQHDSLTGLPNRLHLLELLAKRLLDAESRNGLLAVFFIDLDRFKQINDTLGHLIGDRILVQVAERLKRLLHADDVAGRMGGDEFTVILSNPPDQEFVFRAARQFLQSLRAPYLVDQLELFVTASIGISFYPQDGADAATLLQKSDLAMYSAKNAGKNDLEFFVKDSRSTARERLDMENALRRAQEKSELELNFQPIVSINGELDGMEVLLTWNHPKLGRISPKQFIPIAEESGLIVSIGSWVIQQACLQGSRWIATGLQPTRLSVNVSAIQFARQDFVGTVAAALASTDFPARCLDLELTESFVIQDIAESARQLSRLRELGVRISIDDFGTGYSSLSYLRQLPVDTLKIDQSFLRDLHLPAGSLPVVQTIVSLAHAMNLAVVAEGVQTLDDLELLRAAGCDKVQGYLFGESLRMAEAEQLLASKDRMVPRLAVKPS